MRKNIFKGFINIAEINVKFKPSVEDSCTPKHSLFIIIIIIIIFIKSQRFLWFKKITGR
jgi:hypothetical protein